MQWTLSRFFWFGPFGLARQMPGQVPLCGPMGGSRGPAPHSVWWGGAAERHPSCCESVGVRASTKIADVQVIMDYGYWTIFN